jgi:hypothetical protein
MIRIAKKQAAVNRNGGVCSERFLGVQSRERTLKKAKNVIQCEGMRYFL